MKLDPKLTLQLINFPPDTQRPELFAAISRVALPKKFILNKSQQAYIIFGLESEKRDFIDNFKTADIEIMGQKLKLRDIEQKQNQEKKVVIPVNYKDYQKQKTMHEVLRVSPLVVSAKQLPERGYCQKQVVDSTFYDVVCIVKGADFEGAIKQIQAKFLLARSYQGSSRELVVKQVPDKATVNDVVAAVRNSCRFALKKVALAGQRCFLTFYADEDCQAAAKRGFLSVNGSKCPVSLVGCQQARVEPQEEEFELEEQKHEPEEKSQKVAEKTQQCDESAVSPLQAQQQPSVQIYDPSRPLDEQIEESYGENEDVSEREQPPAAASESDCTPDERLKITAPSANQQEREIFIQNLPLYLPATVTDGKTVKQTLRFLLIQLFKCFGLVGKCIVNEKSGNLCGTAFVEFLDASERRRVLDFIDYIQQYKNASQAQTRTAGSGLRELFVFMKQQGIKQFSLAKFLNLQTGSFKINNQPIYIKQTKTKEQLQKKEEKIKTSTLNEQLLKYGAKISGSGFEKDVPAGDLAKRDAQYKELKQKAANPNYVFQPTRLIMKNLPVAMDEMQVLFQLYRFLIPVFKNKSQEYFNKQRIEHLMEQYKKDIAKRADSITSQQFNFLVEALKLTEIRFPRKGKPAMNMCVCKHDIYQRIQEIKQTGYFGYEMTGMCALEFKSPEAARAFFDCVDNNQYVFNKNKRPIISYAVKNVGVEKARESWKKNPPQPKQRDKRQKSQYKKDDEK